MVQAILLFDAVMDDDSSMSMLANGSPFATSNNGASGTQFQNVPHLRFYSDFAIPEVIAVIGFMIAVMTYNPWISLPYVSLGFANYAYAYFRINSLVPKA